ncbi:MAG: leucine-rich repeat protein [Ruminococcus flavefaciens]|nr:leucine-rich repeat protein [Ruminococcus flavefaciens]MCM1231224.1 leucine-rich repeat protein [Ruminococcus flavefaciens]
MISLLPVFMSSAMISGVSYTYDVSYDYSYGGTAVITSVSIEEGVTDIYIPETIDGYTVTGIGGMAFAGQTSAEKVVIPDTVRSLGNSSFMGCNSLREVVIGTGITSLPDDCFFACSALRSVELPYTLESIGNETFFGCLLLDLYVPDSVYSIGENAFGKNTDPHSNETVNIYGFLVRGVSGSFAETYSAVNHIDFIDMSDYRAGDVNGDGMVDASDASNILNEYAKLSTGIASGFTKKQNIVGDMNSDGMIDAGDASAVLEIYAGFSTGL